MKPPEKKEFTTSNNTKNIQDMWKDKTDADIAQLDANLESQQELHKDQIDLAEKEYSNLRNQTAANYNMQQRAQNEHMANLGFSNEGGTSRSFEQSATNNYNNQLGSINLQERQYANEVDRALRDLQRQYDTDVNNVHANNNLQSTSQQIQNDQWLGQHNLEAAKFNTSQDQFNIQLVWDQEKTKMNNLLELYKSKRITKKQFENLSGLKL